jgi:hypothetical protein
MSLAEALRMAIIQTTTDVNVAWSGSSNRLNMAPIEEQRAISGFGAGCNVPAKNSASFCIVV